MFELQKLVRPNIWALKPYSSARDEYAGHEATVMLDANESPYEPSGALNRYPDPLQRDLKHSISEIKGVAEDHIFLGNGSDEAIDLMYRIFCEPGKDNVVAMSPSYGMYEVCADINDAEFRPVLIDSDFQIDAANMLKHTDAHTKIIFICTPNNPTGNVVRREEVEKLLERFSGMVVVDEAYSDFSPHRPFRLDIDRWPNLVVLNTFSKAFAHAAIRLGMAFASAEVIKLFNKVKYPYNVNKLTQMEAFKALKQLSKIQTEIVEIKESRELVRQALEELPFCTKVFPSDANFLLARFLDADRLYAYLVDLGIIVRNRSRQPLCDNCLRITIGTRSENTKLLAALRNFK